jgi:ATP-dependent DNA helicase RecQ
LTAEQFEVFSALRNLRNEKAKEEGVPAYRIFSNEHLATMVRGSVTTRKELAAIKGVGQATIDKYGAEHLSVLQEFARKAAPAAMESASSSTGAKAPGGQDGPT